MNNISVIAASKILWYINNRPQFTGKTNNRPTSAADITLEENSMEEIWLYTDVPWVTYNILLTHN